MYNQGLIQDFFCGGWLIPIVRQTTLILSFPKRVPVENTVI